MSWYSLWLLDKGTIDDEQLPKVSHRMEVNFKKPSLIKIDLKRMDPIVWLLSRRNSGIFRVELSVVGEDEKEKSLHVVTVVNRAVHALVYKSMESHSMI